mmetsp:Transcript_9076/g.20512  ORF Transcript_9076/g.20512 Transcript_9076/m.20512 type:complete len:148 (-) Transcript_9076:194-637(-)
MANKIRISCLLGHGRTGKWQGYTMCQIGGTCPPTALQQCRDAGGGDCICPPLAKSIEQTMKEGKLVPSSTIIALLKKQLRQFPGSLVALDGFPRNKQNYLDFNMVLGSPEFAIFVDVPDDEMISRIMKRAETSGQTDDNLETAKWLF